VRGEQSGEVLDLRMSCLTENLDEVRALTDVLVGTNETTIARATTAAQGLPPVSRCADLPVLRSAIPLPRDSKTLAQVQALRASLRNARTLADLGNARAAYKLASQLRSQVEDTGYKPLLAELLELIGWGISQSEPANAEPILESAFFAATACGDDVTAASAATNLIYVVGYHLRRTPEAKRWATMCESILERRGNRDKRIRSWFLNDYAAVLASTGDPATALKLMEESVKLREEALGPEHPDVAAGLANLALIRLHFGKRDEALAAADRAVAIYAKSGGDLDASVFANLHANRGDVLLELGRYEEAEREFATALGVVRRELSSNHETLSQVLHGLGEARLAEGQPDAAIPLLHEALAIRETSEVDELLTANTRFALARALWPSGTKRNRARLLAASAREVYQRHHSADKERSVVTWLTSHRAVGS